MCSDLLQLDVLELDTSIINGEQSHAENLLLVDGLHSLHGLLIVETLWILLVFWYSGVGLLEPRELRLGHELVDLKPVDSWVLALRSEISLARTCLRGQVTAVHSAHVRKPTLQFW